MNKCILTGRLTRDIVLKYTSNTQKAVAQFTMAVDRWKKDEMADFILCEVWGQTAETMEKYVKKGHKIGIIGRIRCDSYEDKEGKRQYVTKVVVEELEFLEKKEKTEKSEKTDDQGFHEIDSNGDLPF